MPGIQTPYPQPCRSERERRCEEAALQEQISRYEAEIASARVRLSEIARERQAQA